ncbi:MAG: hypothetical protein C4306_03650, partial [Thermoleophilia bacterium]
DQALSAAEHRTLRRSLRASGSRRRWRGSALRPRLREGLTVASGVAGFLLLGLGHEDPGLALTAGALVAGLVLRLERWRGERLGRRLRRALEETPDLGASIERVASLLPRRPALRWAGIVRWDERGLQGALLGEWGWRAARPGQTALTSWLVRDADLPHDLLLCSGAEVGKEGAYVAVPLRAPDGEATAGFLVLAFGSCVPKRVEMALHDCAGVAVPRLTTTPVPSRAAPASALTALRRTS